MDVQWFRDLAYLAKTGNFTQAAEFSHISQPAFSRRIKALEGWAGVALVDRSRHPVVLTEAGVQILEAGQQAIARLETERRLIREAQSLPDRYVVTFAAQHSIGWRFFPAWLQAFEGAFGPVMSRLRADDLPNCLKDLKDGEVDFVVAYASRYDDGILGAAGLDSIVIGRDRLIAVCKRLPDGRPIFDLQADRTTPLPFLRFGAQAPISQHIEPLLTAYDLHNRLNTVYENAMGGALRIRARDGAGIAWLPKSLVAPDLDSGLLTTTGSPDWSIPLEIRLHRLRMRTNRLTRSIWAYLSVREPVPLVPEA